MYMYMYMYVYVYFAQAPYTHITLLYTCTLYMYVHSIIPYCIIHITYLHVLCTSSIHTYMYSIIIHVQCTYIHINIPSTINFNMHMQAKCTWISTLPNYYSNKKNWKSHQQITPAQRKGNKLYPQGTVILISITYNVQVKRY